MAPRYFLAFLTFTSCTAAIESLKYALKGQEVSLKPDITANSADILWKHNGNKVVEFDGRQELVYGQFESRITLDWHSAELTITDLSFEDSGNYDLEIFRDNKLHLFNYKLEVIENVAKPTISCEMNDDGESGTLACSAEPRQPQSLMKFEWSSHGNVLPGPQLIISLGQKHDDEEYSCHVSNPLSNETATFTAKHCYPENDPGPLIAGVVSAVILLLLIVGIVGVVFCRQTRRACFAEDRTENDSKNQSAPGAAVNDMDAEGQMPPTGRVKERIKNFEKMSLRQTAAKNLLSGSDKKTAQGDETTRLLDRTPTLPSTQALGRGNVNMSPNDSASDDKEDTGSDLDTGKVNDVDSQDQMPPTGEVKECVKNIEQNNDELIVPKNLQTGSDEEAAQGDENAPLLDGAPTLPLGRVHDVDSQDQMPRTECVKNIEQNNDELIVPKNLQTVSDEEAAQGDETTDLYRAPTPTNTQPPGRGSLNMRPNDSASNHKEGTGSVLDTGKGSDKKNAQGDKTTGPLGRTPTLPSTQALGRGNVNMSPNDSASNHKEDTGSDLDAGKVHDVDSQDQMPPTGRVKEQRENIEQINRRHTAPKNLLSGSDKKTAQGDETTRLLGRTPTLPSTQPLGRGKVNMRPNDSASNHKEDTGSDLDAGKGRVKELVDNIEQKNHGQAASKNPWTDSIKNKCEKKASGPSCRDQNNPARNSKAYSDADQLGEAAEKEVPYCPNEPDPAGVPTESSTVPRLSELVKKKEETEGAKSRPANAVSPTAQPCSPLTPNSPNTEAKGTAGEHEEDGNSDEISAGKCDSSGVGKANKSDDSSRDEPSSAIPEDKGSETTLHEQGTHRNDDEQRKEEQSVTEAENGVDNACVGEEAKEDRKPCLASHCDGSSSQESPDTANTDPGQEEENKTRKDSELVKENSEEPKSRPANAVSPTAQPCSPLTADSPNTAAKHTAGKHEGDGNSDEISAGKCDSSGVGKANKSDDSSGDEPSSTIPEVKGSETTPHEQNSNLLKDTQQSDGKQQEEDKSVTEAENGTVNVIVAEEAKEEGN